MLLFILELEIHIYKYAMIARDEYISFKREQVVKGMIYKDEKKLNRLIFLQKYRKFYQKFAQKEEKMNESK